MDESLKSLSCIVIFEVQRYSMAIDIIEKLKWRYATKNFDPSKKISEEKLHILKHSFNLTATSYGLQPIKMVLIGSSDIKNQLVPLTMNQPQVLNASHVIVLCIEKNVTDGYIKKYFSNVETTRKTPREILDPFERFLVDSFSEMPEENIITWASKQAYLALGNLLTVCAVENIDACPIEGFEPEKYDALLNLEEKGLKSVLVMAVGYRDENDEFAKMKKVRRGIDEVVIEIK